VVIGFHHKGLLNKTLTTLKP